jgi:hypothetical protein
MKKNFFFWFFNFSLCIMNCAFSQNPLVKMWDRRYGGTNHEILNNLVQSHDGGFVLGGISYSGIGGDKTEPCWDGASPIHHGDYWIVKVDSLGHKKWDRDFGGSDGDILECLKQTPDGGFILGGRSLSGISGNKTTPLCGTWVSWDFWIVKIDSAGSELWQKDYGGTHDDYFMSLDLTSDGGYIIGGFSYSPVSGDKTQDILGMTDYWILKIDSIGNVQWDKDLGGYDRDELYCVKQTSDGGYILGGTSRSGIGGDKTEAVKGVAGTDFDYWIIKLDSLGNKQWDKDLGGIDIESFYSLEETADNGYILAGESNSGISGDKTEASRGGGDCWFVKIDSSGNKLWDKTFGGNNAEYYLGNVSQTSDRGFLLACLSQSPASGDKSENNLGYGEAWIIKTDSLGIREWDKTVQSQPDQYLLPEVIQIENGCYSVAQHSYGAIAGEKSEDNRDSTHNSADYWIIKFCDSLYLPPVASISPAQNLCPGSCINYLSLSSYATSYQWSFPGATPDTSTALNPLNICYANPGNYDVTLIASNANGSDTLLLPNYISVYPQPSPQSISQGGDTLFALAGSSSYQWYFNGNIINAATNYFYIAQASGDYNVVATDTNGCEVEAAVFNIVAGILPTADLGLLTVFPNPVGNTLNVIGYQLSRTAVEISVYNMFGALAVPLQTANCLLPTCALDVSKFSSGLYYLKITTGQKTFRTKFIKQ